MLLSDIGFSQSKHSKREAVNPKNTPLKLSYNPLLLPFVLAATPLNYESRSPQPGFSMAPNRGGRKQSTRTFSKRPGKSPKAQSGRISKRKPTGPLKKEQRKAALAKDSPRKNAKKKPKTRTYTDEELSLPKLNKITPAGVQKPKGKKKGKVFVDDPVSTTESMTDTSFR